MKDKYVVCILNLKGRKFKEFSSHGNVLFGSAEDGAVELLTPPEGSVAGDLVSFEGQGRDPPAGDLRANNNAYHRINPDLVIGGNKIPKWCDFAMKTEKGDIKVATLTQGKVNF